MATDTTDRDEDRASSTEDRPVRRWAWFAGLYVASIAAVAGAVYGLKAIIDLIVFG